MDRIKMRVSRKSYVEAVEGERYKISIFGRAVSRKIMVEDSKSCNIATDCKRLQKVRKRMGVNKTKWEKKEKLSGRFCRDR